MGRTAQRIIGEHQEIFERIRRGVQFRGSKPLLKPAWEAFDLMFRHILHPKEDPRPFVYPSRPWRRDPSGAKGRRKAE